MSQWTWTCSCGKSISDTWLDLVRERKKKHMAWHDSLVGRVLGRGR